MGGENKHSSGRSILSFCQTTCADTTGIFLEKERERAYSGAFFRLNPPSGFSPSQLEHVSRPSSSYVAMSHCKRLFINLDSAGNERTVTGRERKGLMQNRDETGSSELGLTDGQAGCSHFKPGKCFILLRCSKEKRQAQIGEEATYL